MCTGDVLILNNTHCTCTVYSLIHALFSLVGSVCAGAGLGFETVVASELSCMLQLRPKCTCYVECVLILRKGLLITHRLFPSFLPAPATFLTEYPPFPVTKNLQDTATLCCVYNVTQRPLSVYNILILIFAVFAFEYIILYSHGCVLFLSVSVCVSTVTFVHNVPLHYRVLLRVSERWFLKL